MPTYANEDSNSVNLQKLFSNHDSSKSLINRKKYQTSAPNKSTLFQNCKFNDFLVLTLEKSNLLVDSLGQRMSTEVTLVAFHVVEDYDVL
jgi:hypothetical protein